MFGFFSLSFYHKFLLEVDEVSIGLTTGAYRNVFFATVIIETKK